MKAKAVCESEKAAEVAAAGPIPQGDEEAAGFIRVIRGQPIKRLTA